jgi:hypothetical protein
MSESVHEKSAVGNYKIFYGDGTTDNLDEVEEKEAKELAKKKVSKDPKVELWIKTSVGGQRVSLREESQ